MENKVENTSFTEHLDQQYGKRGNKKREKYEQEFETFKLGVMLQELSKEKGLAQAELAKNTEQQKRIFQELKTMQAIFDYQL